MIRNSPAHFRHPWLRLLPMALVFAACDIEDPSEDSVDPTLSVTGQATFAERYVDQPTSDDAVSGATVTAASVRSTGETRAMSGQTSTDAEGRFALSTELTADPFIVYAQRPDGYFGAVMIEGGAGLQGNIVTPAVTVQSTAAADAFIHSRQYYAGTTSADVAIVVNHNLVSAAVEGSISSDQIGRSVAAFAEAEAAFAMHADGGGLTESQVESARASRRAEYAQLRIQLAYATSAEERTVVIEVFLIGYAQAYGSTWALSPLRQAQVATTGAASARRFTTSGSTQAKFWTGHTLSVIDGDMTAYAVSRQFGNAGASQTTISAVVNAHIQLIASLKAASTAQQVASAHAAYRSAIRARIAGHANVPEATIDAAIQATAGAREMLDATLAGASSGSQVADAYTRYFISAGAAAETALGSGAAGFFAPIIALLALHA